MLYTINLAGTTAEVIETPVSRTLGITDMYRDFRDVDNQHHLEDKLSKLESHAAKIINYIRDTFEEGKQNVEIVRPDRDVLRKFLFIMKYRNSTFHKRFYYQNADHYMSDDKQRLLQYMRKKGYQKPVDVWFDNINTMLDLEMDPEQKWMKWLMEHAYPDDAKWFIAHSQMMYLALCTPSGQDDEFLLTENAYSVHEGPVSQSVDPQTGDMVDTAYSEFHVFSFISPKLVMVLRSFILPGPEEDADESVRTWRETMSQMNASQHNNPRDVKSLLEDLPIAKARNSYTQLVNGRVVLLGAQGWSPTVHDKFCFRFFPISTNHTNMINSIMLEQSYSISTIVFKSKLAAGKTLKHYLHMPCELDGKHVFKIVGDAQDDLRLMFLKKLEQAARQLGHTTTAIYHSITMKPNFECMGQIFAKHLPEKPSAFMRLYVKLGKFLISTETCRKLKICRRKRCDVAKRHGPSSQNAQYENQN